MAKALARYFSFVFHGLLTLILIAVSGVALASGHSLSLDMLPWTGGGAEELETTLAAMETKPMLLIADSLLGIIKAAQKQTAILDGAVIGEQSLVGAGALVTPGTQIPPGSLVLGAPAKVVRELSLQERTELKALAEKYVRTAAYYLEHDINVSALLGA